MYVPGLSAVSASLSDDWFDRNESGTSVTGHNPEIWGRFDRASETKKKHPPQILVPESRLEISHIWNLGEGELHRRHMV